MGRIILTPGGPRHPLEARAPAVRDEATVIIFLAVHSPSTRLEQSLTKHASNYLSEYYNAYNA